MLTKTHVVIDGWIHKIARIEEHPAGPKHTHRVHLGCGMTIDVDVDGQRHAAHAFELRKMAQEARDRKDTYSAPLHLQKAKELDEHAARHKNEQNHKDGRWKKNAKADCVDCAAHEAGAEAVVPDLSHTMPTRVEADIETNISCPTCGSKIYKRRTSSEFACTGQGHSFTAPELMQHLQNSFEGLTKLTE